MYKVEFLRVDGTGELQTAAFYYSHPVSGRSATVIGTSQVGETEYYARLRTVIRQSRLHGATVHLEMPVSSLRESERAPWTQRRSAEQPAVTSYRIQPALNVVDHTDADIVLIWDITTAPALDEALARRGFVRNETRWHVVGRLPGRAAAVADLIAARRRRTVSDATLAR